LVAGVDGKPDLRKAIAEATKPLAYNIASGQYVIRNKATGKVMDVDVSWFQGQKDGQKLIQWSFHGGKNQKFDVVYVSDDSKGRRLYRLYPRHSGKVIEVEGASRANGGPARQWRRTGRSHQLFRIERIGDYYRIIAAHSGKALEVPNGSYSNGAQIAQRSYYQNPAQLWRFIQQ